MSDMKNRCPWTLLNAEGAQRAQPTTYRIPSARARRDLRRGSWAKVVFELPEATSEGIAAERMWLAVKGRRGARYVGVLDNVPVHVRGIARGDEVLFGPEHVVEIASHPLPPEALELLRRAIVTKRVYGEGARPGTLLRAEPVAEGDSGWQILAGDEDDAYLDDEDNLRALPLFVVVQQHPAIAALLGAPVGTVWRWSETSARYEQDPPGG